MLADLIVGTKQKNLKVKGLSLPSRLLGSVQEKFLMLQRLGLGMISRIMDLAISLKIVQEVTSISIELGMQAEVMIAAAEISFLS